MTNPLWNQYPYPSKRSIVHAQHGMVATSHPLASQAGLDILKKGGNAIDAAIATAACLTVVEPTSNGIGGDAFALVWFNDKLHGLNASGIAPELLSIDAIKAKNQTVMPRFGFTPVLVPGIPSAWAELNQKFGKLSLLECLQPAIDYAKNGHPVAQHVAKHWNNAFQIYQKYLKGDEFKEWFKVFAPFNRAPYEGELWKSPTHAKTLQSIGETNAASFYHGELANQIDAYSKQYDGYIRKSDLECYRPLWVDPIGVSYKGYNIWEIPPNGQGLLALQALNILENDTFSKRESIDTYHYQIEAMKLAFSDGFAYLSEPKTMPYSNEALLSKSYAKQRRQLIQETASLPHPGTPDIGGTVYLATADQEGNMVSYIQSNYMGFGSGLVVPNTGIALQNRGLNFSLDPNHPNALAPFKRSYHTIIPGFITKNKNAIGPFGVMGGFMQPQGHLQVVMNLIDFNMNPQSAIDAPRWQWMEGLKVMVEPSVSLEIIEGLRKKGHLVQIETELSHFGRGQIIWKDEDTNILSGGTEPRCDGMISAR